MRYFYILIAAAIGLTYSASAEPKSKRTCRIVFPERPNDAPKLAYLFDGKESQAVTLPSMNFSEVIDLPSGDLTLLMTGSEIKDLENLPLSAPRLNIPETVKDLYILVTADPTNTKFPVRMKMVSASDGKLNPGETLWFNLTDHRIAAKLGEAKMTVSPKNATVSKSPASASGYYRAEFGYQAHGEGDFQRITEQMWWNDTNSRHVGFIVNTGGKLPRIYFFRDFRSPDTEKVPVDVE